MDSDQICPKSLFSLWPPSIFDYHHYDAYQNSGGINEEQMIVLKSGAAVKTALPVASGRNDISITR